MIKMPIHILFILLIPAIFAFQNKYSLLVNNVTVDYVNEQYMLANTAISKINNTNAINFNFTMKFDVPPNVKCLVKAFMWHNQDFQLLIVQLEKNLKDILEMEMFDLQSMFIRVARPPVLWPLKKDVTYSVDGWIPDSTRYPPNLPQGNWKAQVIESLPDKTKILVYNLFMSTKYH